MRQAVVGALNSIGHPDMASRICTMLGEPDALVRESAVKIAGYFGYPECADAVVARCTDDDEAVRAAAIEHLPYFDDGRAGQIFASVLDKDTPRVRAAAAKALGAVPGAPASLLLRKAAGDADAWVRYFAASSMGQQGDGSALDVLRLLATTDTAPHVRIAAIEAIGRIGGDSALAILSPLIADETDIGMAAIRASGAIRSEHAVSALREALRSRDAARRAAAVDAIAACSGEEAIELLQWTASSDGDGNVVQAALNGLGTIANRNIASERSSGRRAGRTSVRSGAAQRRDRGRRPPRALRDSCPRRIARHRRSAGTPRRRRGTRTAVAYRRICVSAAGVVGCGRCGASRSRASPVPPGHARPHTPLRRDVGDRFFACRQTGGGRRAFAPGRPGRRRMNAVLTREPRRLRSRPAASARTDSPADGVVLRERPQRAVERSTRPAGCRTRLPVVSRLLLPAEIRPAVGRHGLARGDGRAVCAGDVFLARGRSTSGADVPRAAGAAARDARRDGAYLEHSVRDRRGAVDDRDGARRSGLVRPRAHRNPRQRRQPRGDRQSAGRTVPRTIVPLVAGATCGTSTSSPAARSGRRSPRCSGALRRGPWST